MDRPNTVELLWEHPEIFRIEIPIPENPLKSLNCFVVRQGEEALVIDTGFRRPECGAAFFGGLRALGVRPERSTLFLTHVHGDHTGLAVQAEEMGMRILMGRLDYGRLRDSIEGDSWTAAEELFRSHGFPEEELALQRGSNHARLYAVKRMFRAQLTEDGDRFCVGSLEFTCVWTPGHSPGHMCLYLPQEKLLFAGDHILYDITPNISIWVGVRDPLGDYLKSLEAVSRLEVVRAFAAHREQGEFLPRIEELKRHHRIRLEEAYRVLAEREGQTAYQVAQKMTWSMHGLPWAQFPPGQKWFATGEAASHLIRLVETGRAGETLENGLRLYSARA